MAGCWSDDPLVDGELTADQLAALRLALHRPDVDPCKLPTGDTVHDCNIAALLGQQLFFDVRLSNQIDPAGSPIAGSGTTSCATCHDPTGYFIDTRSPNNVSLGQKGWTKRNAMTVLDVGLKYDLAHGQQAFFVWSGFYKTPGQVLELATNSKAFGTTTAAAIHLIEGDPTYAMEYTSAIGPLDETTIFAGVESALDAYMFRLTSTSPFDKYVAGDDTAISDAAKRGFGVFVGRGTCIECHSGPTLSDLTPHVTGVPQGGPEIPDTDLGRGSASGDMRDDGAFVTASLRNIAKTGPYMHDGYFQSLAEVIDFYRKGGEASVYTKDPRIQPLDITDDDVADLEAFLNALTETPVDKSLQAHLCDAMNGNVGWVCNGTCTDVVNDPKNCGSCGNACTGNCMAGTCL